MTETVSSQLPHVVLCEGYEALLESLGFVLRDRYRVTSISQTEALLTLLERTGPTPALVILDIDGQPGWYDCLVSLRQAYPNLCVLLLANQFTLEQQVAAVQLTDIRFLQKAFSPKQFLEKVETLIQGYSRSP